MASIDIDLLIKTANSAASLKDVRTQMKAIKNAMLEVGDDSKEFNKLGAAAAELSDKMDDVNQRVKSFNPDGFAALTNFAGKAAGAVSAVTGAMALFGTQSEDVQKALLKVQGALALAQGLDQIKGLGAAYKDLNAVLKNTTVWQKLQNLFGKESAATKLVEAEATVVQGAATTTTTTAQKGLNAAMKANPLGAIIVAITALIAIFVTLNAIMGGASKATLKLAEDNEKLKKTNEDLNKLSENRQKVLSSEAELLKAQGAPLEEILKKEREINAEKLASLDRNIAVIKSTIELDKAKAKDVETNDSLWESIMEIVQATQEFLGQTELAEQTEKAIAANKAERAQEFLDDLKVQQDALAVAEADREAAVNGAAITEINAQNEITARNKEAHDARVKAAQEAADAERKINQDLWDETLRLIEAQEAAADKQVADDAERAKQNEEDWTAALLAIDAERDAAYADEDARVKAAQLRDEMIARARLDAVAGLFGSLSQLAGKNQKMMKAFSVAEATINTYRGVTAALADPLLPFPIKLINAATVLASGLANVKKILSVEPSSGGGGGAATSGGGSLGAFGGVSAINNAPAQPNVPQPSTQLNPDGSVANQNQPIRVYVLENDIREKTNRVDVAEAAVSFR